MPKGVEPMRRSDIAYVTVKYSDGDEETISAMGFNGHIKKFVNHDAGNRRDRKEWDEVEITLVGPKRPVQIPDAQG